MRGGASQRLENNYITEVLPQEWKFGVPHQASQTDGLTTGVEPPERLALKASSVWSQDFHKLGEEETPLLEGAHKVYVHREPVKKAVIS